MHRMTYSSVHLCNPPEAISVLQPFALWLAACKVESHLTSYVFRLKIILFLL